MSEPRLLAYDIETRPHSGYVWGLFDQRLGLNQIIEFSSVMCFAARWVDDPKDQIIFRSEFHDGREAMVRDAWNLFNEADYLVTWNGRAFDNKHMNREFDQLQLGPPSPTKDLDLLLTARRRFKYASNKLEHISKQLGLDGKVPHEGMPLWINCMAGDRVAWDKMREYNEQDVHLLIEIYERWLPWISGHPNMNLYSDDVVDGCHKCGSGNVIKDGKAPTLTGLYQRFYCKDCKSWSQSGKALARVDIRESK